MENQVEVTSKFRYSEISNKIKLLLKSLGTTDLVCVWKTMNWFISSRRLRTQIQKGCVYFSSKVSVIFYM